MASWAVNHIAKLAEGETIQFRPHGNSMAGKIDNGQLVTVEPVVDNSLLSVGDIVLCKVKGRYYLHLVDAVKGEWFMIKNNHGFQNGWTNKIYGRVIAIEN